MTQGGKTVKRITLLAIVLVLISTVGAFAQDFKNESEFYSKTLQINQIYNNAKGFKVEYIRQDYTLGSFWAPIEWFRGAASTGEIAYGDSAAYPYVSFFYKSGELDHFRLYLFENPAHASWGSLDPTVDYSAEFPSPDSKPVISY